MHNRKKIRQMTLIGMLLALMILFQFVPIIGYIPTPWGVSITIMPVITLLAGIAIHKLTKINGIIAGVIVALIRAGLQHLSVLIYPGGFGYIWMNPLFTLLPITLWGIFIGVMIWLIKNPKWLWVIGVLGALMNTLFIVGSINIFQPDGYEFFTWMILVQNTLPEAVLAGIITFGFSKGMRYIF